MYIVGLHEQDHDLLVTKVKCEDLPDSDWGDFRCQRAADSSSLLQKITF